MNKELEAPVIFNTEPFGYIFKKGELVHVIEAEPALTRIKELEMQLEDLLDAASNMVKPCSPNITSINDVLTEYRNRENKLKEIINSLKGQTKGENK